MSSLKHTPGPWQHKHLNFLQICDADGEGRGCAPIAQIAGGKNGETRAEARANARLIVAAPDLLVALEEIVKNDPLQQSSAGVIARAAIAKVAQS